MHPHYDPTYDPTSAHTCPPVAGTPEDAKCAPVQRKIDPARANYFRVFKPHANPGVRFHVPYAPHDPDDADVMLMRSIALFVRATTLQLAMRHGAKVNTVTKRMRRLVGARYAAKSQDRSLFQADAYHLTPKGYRCLKMSPPKGISCGWLTHWLAVNDVILALEKALPEHGWELADWTREEVLGLDGETPHRIDLIFQTTSDVALRRWVCEVDRDPDGDYSILAQVNWLARFRPYAQDYDLKGFRTLILTRDERRREKLLRRAPAYYREYEGGDTLFWFGVIPTIDRYQDITARMFYSADGRTHSIAEA